MQKERIGPCLAALEAAEQALLDAGDSGTLVHITLAIDRFRATHRLPGRTREATDLPPTLPQAGGEERPER